MKVASSFPYIENVADELAGLLEMFAIHLIERFGHIIYHHHWLVPSRKLQKGDWTPLLGPPFEYPVDVLPDFIELFNHVVQRVRSRHIVNHKLP